MDYIEIEEHLRLVLKAEREGYQNMIAKLTFTVEALRNELDSLRRPTAELRK